MRSNQRRWSLAWTMYLKLAVVSSFDWHRNSPHFKHICLNCNSTVSQALKIGDNNVIESKGEALAFSSICAWISVENCGTLVELSNKFNSSLSSWCWQECDPHQRLYHRSVLPAQHLRGHSWEYCPLRLGLSEAGPDGETTGTDARLVPSVARPFPCFSIFSFLQPQTLQLDFLMKILPNYHHLKKTVKAGHHPG